MSLMGLIVFAGIYATAVASPGPGVAAIVARSLRHGFAGFGAFAAGFVAGDLTLMLLAATGLAVVVKAFGSILVAIKLIGAAYLLYLAWKLWRTPVMAPSAGPLPSDTESPWRLFLGSYSLTVGNPKAIVFFMAILPTVVDLRVADATQIATIGLVIVVIMPLVLAGYALAADRARRLFTETSSLRALNRFTAVVMAGAAAAVAAS